MSRNGSGVYSLPPGSVIANGQTSDATDLNTPLADIASDLNVARPVVAGGTGAANASDARTNLGVAIGTNVQAFDDTLTSLADLGTAADKLAYTTGVDTWAEADLTAAGLALLDDADAAAQRTTLGLGTAALMANSADTDLTNDPDAALRRDIAKTYIDGESAGPVATTSGSAIEFNSIPADVTEIEVILNGTSLTGTSTTLFQLSSGGVYETTGYSATCSRSNVTSVTQSDFTTGIPVTNDSAAQVLTGNLRISKEPGSNFWIGSGLFYNGATSFETSGSIALAGVLDGVRITASGADTFDAGQVSIKYKRRAA